MRQRKTGAPAAWLRKNRLALWILLLAAAIFAALYGYAHSGTRGEKGDEYAEYETAGFLEILSDSCEPDPNADGAYRGDQSLLVEVTSGQYRGQTLLTTNAVGPLYGEPAALGDRGRLGVCLIIIFFQLFSDTGTVFTNGIIVGVLLA